jgi:hypothetical protein
MDQLMFKLLCQIGIEEATEMLRELRELEGMSPSEREIYALLYPDASIFVEADTATITSAREDILMFLN